jgi:3-oxoacyl-[acyl-carrier protein] reductase
MSWTLVTGGAKRLGANVCLSLAQKGYSVVVHYNRSQQEALDIVQQCRAFNVEAEAIQGDLSSLETTSIFVERYLSQFSETMCLINNVGNYLIKSLLHTSSQEWLNLIQTNVLAPLTLTQALIPSIKRHRGNIINIGTSGLRLNKADCYSPAYTITKQSLWLMTDSLAKELASHQVTVNMVSPGQLDISVDLPPVERLPMHRPATCSEISRVILFLMNPESGYITGQNIEVAGGFRL